MPANHELWKVQFQPGLYPVATVVKKAVQETVKEESWFIIVIFL